MLRCLWVLLLGLLATASQAQGMPGWTRVVLSPVSTAESAASTAARPLPVDLNRGLPGLDKARPDQAATAVARTASSLAPDALDELARALRFNVDLIYEHLRDHIAYYPVWGIQKGPLGAILDNAGTAFDQASLMVALLRKSGYTASFVSGQINLTAAQLQDWLGIDTHNGCAATQLLVNGQIPGISWTASTAGTCPPLASIKLRHVWVKVNIGGTDYHFDPSFKPHTRQSAIDLAAISGYNATTYLNDARNGATVLPDAIQGVNRNQLRANLATYANRLAAYLRANQPAAGLADAIGGKTIVPHTGGNLRQLQLPYLDAAVSPEEWTDIPSPYKPTLQIQYANIDQTYTSDAIYGKRLTLTFNGANQPELRLDGSLLATGSAVGAGTTANIVLSIAHVSGTPYPPLTQSIKAGGTYLIGNGWGPTGRGLVEHYRSGLVTAKATGSTDGSEATLGASLAILAADWLAQANQSAAIADRLAGTNTLFHHQVGIAGYQDDTPYVDLPGNVVSVTSESGEASQEEAAFYNLVLHSSVFESVAVQQTTRASAVSTVKLIDIAAQNGDQIFDATLANFASIGPSLLSCSAWLTSFQSEVSAGHRLILPARCNLGEGAWSGIGYFNIRAAGRSIGAVIGKTTTGGLLGGAAATPVPWPAMSTSGLDGSTSPSNSTRFGGTSLADPIDLAKGHFLYAHDDLSVGLGDFPQRLSFHKLYASGAYGNDGPLGRGWTHNLAIRAGIGSDGFQGLGEDSALDAVGAIVEHLVSLDLLSDTAKPLDKLVVATLGARWFGDQMLDNAVIVRQGLNGEFFVKLPDGSYNAPPGNAAKLVKNPDSTYTYQTLHQARLDFDSTGKIAAYRHPSGVQVSFTYSGNDLLQVENSLGRVLNFTTVAGRIAQVGDGARSVLYGYDPSGNGNLVSTTDATARQTVFRYDIPGRMTQVFSPENPTNPFVSNVYDSLGRIQTQTNANGKTSSYFFAGSRTEEVAPDAASTIAYLDALGKVLKSIDAVGRITRNTYDGQSRLVKTVLPEGNGVEYAYDDAPCLSQGRCTHNVKTIRLMPKSGSVLPARVHNFTYESAFNNVASATDPRGQTTVATYTARGEPWVVTGPADATGQRPVTSYAYGPYGSLPFYLPTSVTRKIDAATDRVTTTAYNAANKYVPQTTVVDAGAGRLNLATTVSYDGIGNLTAADGPRTDVADTVTLAYDAERRVTQVTNALGKVTQQGYDADGRPNRTAAQIGTQWLVACQSYSPSGKLLKTWGPVLSAAAACPAASAPGTVTGIDYDDRDRVWRVTQNLSAAEGGNRLAEFAYAADGQLRYVVRAASTPLQQTTAIYTYTPNGLVNSVTDAKGNLTTFLYDDFDRRFKTRFPDKTTAGLSSATDEAVSDFDEGSAKFGETDIAALLAPLPSGPA